MVVKTGKLQIAKVGEDVHEVRLGVPGWKKGDPAMLYEIEFVAKDFENVSMERGEWPPTKKDGSYILQAAVLGFPWDRFRVYNVEWIKCSILPQSEIKSFDITYIDETAEKPKEEVLAKGVTEATWYASPPIKPEQIVLIGLGTIAVIGGIYLAGRMAEVW